MKDNWVEQDVLCLNCKVVIVNYCSTGVATLIDALKQHHHYRTYDTESPYENVKTCHDALDGQFISLHIWLHNRNHLSDSDSSGTSDADRSLYEQADIYIICFEDKQASETLRVTVQTQVDALSLLCPNAKFVLFESVESISSATSGIRILKSHNILIPTLYVKWETELDVEHDLHLIRVLALTDTKSKRKTLETVLRRSLPFWSRYRHHEKLIRNSWQQIEKMHPELNLLKIAKNSSDRTSAPV